MSSDLLAGLVVFAVLVGVFILALFDRRAGEIRFGVFFSRRRTRALEDDTILERQEGRHDADDR